MLGFAAVVPVAIVHAQPAGAQSKGESPRPKIGLVLSGGGARGVAHVGVLRVLEELRIPVDYIVGTSMGSIVAGAYSVGLSPDQMQRRIHAVRWDRVLTDQPPRAERSVRSKRIDRLNIYGAELGIRDGELLFPGGVIGGQQLERFLGSLIGGAVDLRSFDQLPIPFRAIATDVETGGMVILDRGNLAAAMRASMSVPGAFSAKEIDGRLLVDGGLVRNLPIDVARQMGAQVIIAVNLGTPLLKREDLNSVLGVTAQMINILTEQNVQASLGQLGPGDVLILPELGDFSAGDFAHATDTIPIGERAARKVEDQLRRYSLDKEEYTALRTGQLARGLGETPRVDRVRVETAGLRYVNPDSVKAQMQSALDRRPSPDQLDRDVQALYATDDFEAIYYKFKEQDGERVLVIEPVEKRWGRNYLRAGLHLSSNLEGESDFTIGIDQRATWLNPRGLEWRNQVYLGQRTGWASELYQPLDLARTWFVAPTLNLDQRTFDLFVDDEAVARYKVRSAHIGLQAGRRFGTAGEARLGYLYGTVKADPNIGVSQFPDVNVTTAAFIATVEFDQFDNWAFPSDGWYTVVDYSYYDESLGSDTYYQKGVFDFGYAFGAGRHSVVLGAIYGTRFGTDLPSYDAFQLGGLFQLSGYQLGQLLGTGMTLGRLIYFYRLGGGGGQLASTYYLGGSLEAGNVSDRLNGPPRSGVIVGSSLFIAADTLLGPLYLAAGYADGGNFAMYLFLGRF